MLALYFTSTREKYDLKEYIYLRNFQKRCSKLQLSKVCIRKMPKTKKLSNSTKFFMLQKRQKNGRTLQDLVTGPYVDRYNSVCRDLK